MGHIERILSNLLKDVGSSIRKFTAFVFLVFAAGVVMGGYAIQKDPFTQQMAYVAPLVLALAAYFFTEIAIAFFFLFLIVLLLL